MMFINFQWVDSFINRTLRNFEQWDATFAPVGRCGFPTPVISNGRYGPNRYARGYAIILFEHAIRTEVHQADARG
jgi:hypothetical protein